MQAHGTDFLLGGNAEEGEVFSSAFPQSAAAGTGGGRIETGVLAIKKSWIVYRLQHYENRRLFDFLLRTEPTVDAT